MNSFSGNFPLIVRREGPSPLGIGVPVFENALSPPSLRQCRPYSPSPVWRTTPLHSTHPLTEAMTLRPFTATLPSPTMPRCFPSLPVGFQPFFWDPIFPPLLHSFQLHDRSIQFVLSTYLLSFSLTPFLFFSLSFVRYPFPSFFFLTVRPDEI